MLLELTRPAAQPKLSVLCAAPHTLHERILALIDREAEHAAAGRGGRIIAKMNALVEVEVIEALYRAAQAGVEIDLIVRGICCLRPGVPGVSETIRVRSLVGRFLEHARVFLFGNGGATEVFLSSADWMERNFFSRVEVCVPVIRASLRRRLEADLQLELADNRRSWQMQADGSWLRVRADGEPPVCAQDECLAGLAQSLSRS
jgi:polyphosphate kinase